MYFDFEALLVILTVVTGIVWGWDKWRARREGKAREDVSWWVDLSRSLFPVILVVLVIRSFLVEPFRIPSGSMVPTLLDGDFILVNKFAYGVRLPVTGTEVIPVGEPERGDVMVFRYPVDPSQDYIKRVIGLPGDQVAYRNKHLYINGELMDQLLLGRYTGAGGEPDSLVKREDLGDEEHLLLLHSESPDRDYELTVPDDSYFVMGDNRDRSSDSRIWGFVPESNLVGEAFVIWMSWDPNEYRINWDRIGELL